MPWKWTITFHFKNLLIWTLLVVWLIVMEEKLYACMNKYIQEACKLILKSLLPSSPNKKRTKDSGGGCCPKTAYTIKFEVVLHRVEENQSTTVRAILYYTGSSNSAVQRVLHEQLMHFYHLQRVSAIYPGYYPQWLAFYQKFLVYNLLWKKTIVYWWGVFPAWLLF